MILALETSCDDTCAAVLGGDGVLRSNVISSQGVHDLYGGVVPEVASRHHLQLVNRVVDDALHRADASLDDGRARVVAARLDRQDHRGTASAFGTSSSVPRRVAGVRHIT